MTMNKKNCIALVVLRFYDVEITLGLKCVSRWLGLMSLYYIHILSKVCLNMLRLICIKDTQFFKLS